MESDDEDFRSRSYRSLGITDSVGGTGPGIRGGGFSEKSGQTDRDKRQITGNYR